MRIKNLVLLEENVKELGLKPFNSKKLNNSIALVGKNGSGKSRYLKTIENKLKNIEILDLLNGHYDNLPTKLAEFIGNYSNHIEVFTAFKNLSEAEFEKKQNPNSEEARTNYQSLHRIFTQANNKKPINTNTYDQINNNIRSYVKQRVKVIKTNDLRQLRNNLEKNSDVKISFQDIIDSTTENIELDEFSTINNSALSFLQRLPHMLAFDDIDTKGDEKKFKSRISFKRFQLLSKLVEEFLGKKLEWKRKTSNVDVHDDHINVQTTGFWLIDGREFNYSQFSEGEKVLFAYALLLFLLNTNPKIRFNESIIIIDEPELNLHPKAQIKLIESLQELIKDEGQLIIATHSLSIVANLDYSSIFLVRESELWSPSSNIPFDSVEELMGFNEHYNKIVEFLVSTPSWAMTNFMAECFDNPEVFAKASKSDPQLEVFKELITRNNSVKILDFGSGKGRLIDRIKENNSVWSRITEYDCFDIESEYNQIVLEKGANKVFNSLDQIIESSYDIIVMVNVLHEIHVKHWTKSFNKIKKSLKPGGVIAIVEDLHLPIGELPNEHGFLILGKDELKILLGDKIRFISSTNPRYTNRIICGLISGSDMKTLNKDTIIKALKKLKSNSLQEIKKYRALDDKKANLGRLYALKSNLYVNSDFAIEHLEN